MNLLHLSSPLGNEEVQIIKSWGEELPENLRGTISVVLSIPK
jgi:hypothetical protein